MNDETKMSVKDFKTKNKTEVSMKKTIILAVVLIVAQGAFAVAPGAKPAHLTNKGNTETALSAMGVKKAGVITADKALEIARIELGVKNENLRADKMTDGFIKLIQLAGEAQKSTKAEDKDFANSVKLIAENVGKIEVSLPQTKLTESQQAISDSQAAGKRMVFEVLPDLILEGSAESKALIVAIGKGIEGKMKLYEATYDAVRKTYPHLKDSKDIMEKVREILNCNKA